MRIIKNPTNFRQQIRNKINIIINNENISLNIEKGIYNYTITTCSERKIVKKWTYPEFVLIYEDKLRSIFRNLKNTHLVEQLINKEFKAHKIAFMTHQEMLPDRWKYLLEKKKEIEKNLFSSKLEANTDAFTCYKCKSNKCSYYQLQTRSADEPMTTFVTCLNCDTRWKC